MANMSDASPAKTLTDLPTNLMGLDQSALAALIAAWGDKPFRAKQLSQWVHQRGVADFQEMTDLALAFRGAASLPSVRSLVCRFCRAMWRRTTPKNGCLTLVLAMP